jgi:hypothetical protein
MPFSEDDDFSSNEPQLEESSNSDTNNNTDSPEARRAARKAVTATALSKYFETKTDHGLDVAHYKGEHLVALLETFANVVVKTHSKNDQVPVCYDRTSGQYISPDEAAERIRTAMPSLTTAEYQAMIKAKQDIARMTTGEDDKNGNKGGSGAPAAPRGPSATYVKGFEQDPVLLTPEQNRARAECLRYYDVLGAPKCDPTDGTPQGERFKELLFAAQPEGFEPGFLIQTVQGLFRQAGQTKFANTATKEQLIALSADEWKALTPKQKTVLQTRLSGDRGAGWSEIVAERSKLTRTSPHDPHRGTKLEGKDPWVAYYLAQNFAPEVAERLGAQDKARGRRLPNGR